MHTKKHDWWFDNISYNRLYVVVVSVIGLQLNFMDDQISY